MSDIRYAVLYNDSIFELTDMDVVKTTIYAQSLLTNGATNVRVLRITDIMDIE